MQMLGNLRAKRNLYFIYSDLPPFLSKNRSRTTKGGWYLLTLQRNSAIFTKKLEYFVSYIMYFFMNVIIARQKFSAHPIYLPFSKCSYRQNMFWSRNLSSNMPKITSFSLKNRPARSPHLPYSNTNSSLRA